MSASNGINVLSLFDGIGGAYYALKLASIPVNVYHRCEIDKHANQIFSAQGANNHGDVCALLERLEKNPETLGSVDLIVFGSPCQDLSIAKRNRTGLEGSRSSLFRVAAQIIDILKPRYFLMENVASMRKSDRDEISARLGVRPVEINSRQLSALVRPRLYWCNWPVDVSTLPVNSPHTLADVIEEHPDPALHLTPTAIARLDTINERSKKRKLGYKDCIIGPQNKMLNLDASYAKGPDGKRGVLRSAPDAPLRIISPLEAERLQGFPEGHTAGVARTHRYKALGNSFTVPVVAWLLQQSDMSKRVE